MDPFAAAVRAEPDDDLPRLIYADYLEERGDPRGQFIRTQIEKAQLSESDPRHRELSKHEAELLSQYEDQWLGELGDELVRYWFHRGFLEVRLDVRRFLHGTNPWLDRPTVANVHLYAPRQMTIELVEELANDPRTTCARSLLLGFEYIRDPGAKMLAESPYLRQLMFLDLGTNGITDTGAIALAKSPGLPALRHLLLTNNLIADAGAAALGAIASLHHLDLANNEITSVGALALARGPGLNEMESLTLAGNSFDGRSSGGRAHLETVR